MSYAIETDHLTKKFGTNTVVNNLSCRIPEGSIFAFLGPNGAGKTTTIKMLMNIISPNSGRAKILGVDSQKLSPREFRQIGYVSENQEMPEWMTVKEFLAFCKHMYPSWNDDFCGRLLNQFELPLNAKLKDLSRGMKMKTSLISSLAYQPKLLILDEPFSGLDPLVRDEFISGILDITENERWTIFVSSHDIDEVERLADWVGIIDHGGLKITQRTEDLQKRFRKIEVTLPQPMEDKIAIPDHWFDFKKDGRNIRFIDSLYSHGESEQKLRALLPGSVDIVTHGLTLREIFLACAKKYKINSI